MAEAKKSEPTPTEKPAQVEAAVPAAAAPADAPKKKNNTALKVILIVGGVVVVLMILGAVAMAVFVGSIFNHAAKNVQVNGDGKNGSVTVKSDDGKNSTTFGNGAKLPDGFPTDIPIYKPSTLVAASNTDNTRYSASGKTNDSVSSVVSYYKDQLGKGGWAAVHETSYGDGNIMNFKKDTRLLTISVSNQEHEENEKTFFSLSVSPADY
jgi:hypothetical protein